MPLSLWKLCLLLCVKLSFTSFPNLALKVSDCPGWKRNRPSFTSEAKYVFIAWVHELHYIVSTVLTPRRRENELVTSSACMKQNSLPSAELILNSAFTLHKVEQIHCTKYDLPCKIHGWLAAKLHGKLAQGWLNSSDAKKPNQNQEKNYFPVCLAPETAWFACWVRASRGRWIHN